jgi:hypothetical protein
MYASAKELFELGLDARLVETEMRIEIIRRAGTPILGHADALHKRRLAFAEYFGNRAAESADDTVILDRDDPAGFLRGLRDIIGVDRGDGVDVDNANVQAPPAQVPLPP